MDFDTLITWPAWAKDAIVIDTRVVLSWGDALRVLVRRSFTITTKTFVETPPGRAETISRCEVAPLWPQRSSLASATRQRTDKSDLTPG
mgnify:CR=1 FL=1